MILNTATSAVLRDRRASAPTSRALRLAVPLVAAAVLACGDTQAPRDPSDPGEDRTVSTVTVSPAVDTLAALGETHRFSVVALDRSGRAVTGIVIGWSSSENRIATVDTAGVVTAVRNGTVVLSAAAEAVTGTARVVVEQRATSLVVTPATDTLLTLGSSTKLAAAVTDARGNSVNQAVVWNSSNLDVATVDDSGLVIATGRGVAVIEAESGAVQGDAGISVVTNEVMVLPAGGSYQDSSGRVRLDIPPSAVQTPTVISIDPDQSAAPETLVPGTAFVFQPTGLQFAVDIRLTIAYDAMNVDSAVPESRLRLSELASGEWTALPTSTVDETAKTVAADIAGFSVYGVTGTVPVGSVEILPPDTSLVEGDTVRLAAVLRDDAGGLLQERTVTWVSVSATDPGGALVDSSGLVSAIRPGTYPIAASSEGASDTAIVTVTPIAIVATVEIQPADTAIVEGDTVRLAAVLRDGDGNSLDNVSVFWSNVSATDPGGAPVDSSGLVSAIRAGIYPIAATSGEVADTSIVTVSGSGAPAASVTISPSSRTLLEGSVVLYFATVVDSAGAPLDDRPVTWTNGSESQPSGVLISAAGLTSAIVTAVDSGTYPIIASVDAVADTATLVVVPDFLVVVSPETDTVGIGEIIGLVATMLTPEGDTVPDQQYTWRSSDLGVAIVQWGANSSSVRVTGIDTGTAVITASSVGREGSAVVLGITEPTRQLVVVTETDTLRRLGDTTTIRAYTLNQYGDTIPNAPLSWGPRDPTVIGVSGDSLRATATALGYGTTAVIASERILLPKVDSVMLSVVPYPVGAVAITPSTASIDRGLSVQLTAEVRDSLSDVVTDRPVTWSNASDTDPGGATVDATGFVTGVRVGVYPITATAEAVTDTALITVVEGAPVASVTVSPPSVTVLAGEVEQFSAELRDADGNVLQGRETVWSTVADTNPDGIIVDQTGLATTLERGTYGVVATSEGVSDTASIDVIAPLRFTSVSAQAGGCAIEVDGTGYCWGQDNLVPTRIAGTVTLSAIDATSRCGITTGNAGMCWVGDWWNDPPVALPGGSDLVQVTAANDRDPCVLTADSLAYCWVWSPVEGLGNPPVAVAPDLRFAALHSGNGGGFRGCAVTAAGDVYCWGSLYPLGDGTSDTASASSPVKVSGNLTFASVSVGATHSCGVTTDSAAYCWGSNERGELGVGIDVTESLVPIPVVGGLKFLPDGLDARTYFTCGVTIDGDVYCWGRIGLLNFPGWYEPELVPGGVKFSSVSVDLLNQCGMGTDAFAYCWGFGQNGRLGNGGTLTSDVPVRVALQSFDDP